jgi:hypothetical protein
MPTHAHGQGYSDINFMIPELIELIEYKKGTYFAEEGNFSAEWCDDHLLPRRYQCRAQHWQPRNGYARALFQRPRGAGNQRAAPRAAIRLTAGVPALLRVHDE